MHRGPSPFTEGIARRGGPGGCDFFRCGKDPDRSPLATLMAIPVAILGTNATMPPASSGRRQPAEPQPPAGSAELFEAVEQLERWLRRLRPSIRTNFCLAKCAGGVRPIPAGRGAGRIRLASKRAQDLDER